MVHGHQHVFESSSRGARGGLLYKDEDGKDEDEKDEDKEGSKDDDQEEGFTARVR